MLGPMKSGVLGPAWRSLVWGVSGAVLSLGTFGCDEEKSEPAKAVEKKAEEAPAPPPVEESPPHLVISDEGPTVRGLMIEGAKKTGLLATPELDKLKNSLADEKKFIEGKELTVIVDRKAKRGWVGAYLKELGELGAAKLTVVTETRAEFSGSLEFVAPTKGDGVAPCTMIGQITEHNGSALWQVEGGTAKERGPGLGGPDLSMAKEVIATTYEKCESDIFVTDGENTKDWGFIYDMAAAAVSTPDAGIKRGFLPAEPQTKGRPVKF